MSQVLITGATGLVGDHLLRLLIQDRRVLLLDWEMFGLGDPALDVGDRAAIRPFVHEHLGELLAERGIVLNRGEKRQLLEAVVAELSNSLP